MLESRRFRFIWAIAREERNRLAVTFVAIAFSSVILGSALMLILPVVSQLLASGTEGEVTTTAVGSGLIVRTQRWTGLSVRSAGLLSLFMAMTFNFFIQYIISCMNAGLSARMTYACRQLISSALIGNPCDLIEQSAKGDLIQLTVNEARVVYAFFKQLFQLVITLMNCSIIFLVLLWSNWFVTLFLGVLGIVLLGGNKIFTTQIRRLSRLALTQRMELMSCITDVVFGLWEIKLFGAQGMIGKKVDHGSHQLADTNRRVAVVSARQVLFTQSIGVLGAGLIAGLWYSTSVDMNATVVSAGIISYMIVLGRLVPAVGGISKSYGVLISAMPSLHRIEDFLSNTKTSADVNAEEVASPTATFQTLELSNVVFSYMGTEASKPLGSLPVLDRCSLQVRAGDYIGLVGESGCGKSTIIGLLIGKLWPNSGNVLVNGRPLCKQALPAWWKQVGLVRQEFHFFRGTIREALLMAMAEASDEMMWNALASAGLDREIRGDSKGLDTELGNNADRLSVGQRQRLALAMLLLKDPQLIILDEGTSNIDEETEESILTVLKELNDQGKTIIFIAHKRKSLRDTHRIYRLKEGQLISERYAV